MTCLFVNRLKKVFVRLKRFLPKRTRESNKAGSYCMGSFVASDRYFSSGKETFKIQVTTAMKWMLVPGWEIPRFCGDQLNDSPHNKVQSNNKLQIRNSTLITIVWRFWGRSARPLISPNCPLVSLLCYSGVVQTTKALSNF